MDLVHVNIGADEKLIEKLERDKLILLEKERLLSAPAESSDNLFELSIGFFQAFVIFGKQGVSTDKDECLN